MTGELLDFADVMTEQARWALAPGRAAVTVAARSAVSPASAAASSSARACW